MNFKFQDLESFDINDIEAAINRNSSDELPLVPIAVALSSFDAISAMHVCARLALHCDPSVRGNAILSLGHLARRFNKLDKARILPLIEQALKDDDDQVRSKAKTAADEIHQFAHWIISGHIYG